MDPAIDLVVRAGFALLLATAAVHKLATPSRFRATLTEYRIVPPPLAGVASVLVVGTEVALAGALLVPAVRGAALAGAAALLTVYGAVIAVNLLRGRTNLDCGCLAGDRRVISWWLVARNATLAALATTALAPVDARPLAWVDAVTVLGALATAALVWTAVDGLLGNRAGVARIRDAA
jgi:uncharacterized membrane protein